MSYMAALGTVPGQSSAQLARPGVEENDAPEHRTAWQDIWSEAIRTHAVKVLPLGTGSWIVCIPFETIPVHAAHFGTNTKEWLAIVEVAFGASATHLAQILRVSRPMIYHYRKGMEPSAENKRRLQVLAEFMNDWVSQLDQSFEAELKTVQPEGRSLLDYLSDSELDFVTLRRVINRSLGGRRRDRALRNQLADELTREETIEARQDIVRERHASGKPVYVGDPDNPGNLIQMLPNGRRIRGQMVNRQFVPDEK